MSIETVLDKIVDHNTDVRACILSSGDKVYHNLSGAYQMIDATKFSEHARNMLNITDVLEDDRMDADVAFVEYDDHSLMVKSLNEDDTLILINNHMSRPGFKKLQVGINLFLKPLERAKVDQAKLERDAPPLVANPDHAATPMSSRTKPVEGAEVAPIEHVGKKKRIYRGVVFWE